MAQLFCTGPCHIYLGAAETVAIDPYASGTVPYYLGTAEGAPNIEVTPAYTGVMNDLRGQSQPIDRSFDGEEAVIQADLTRWNEAVYAQITARPNAITGTRGSYGAQDLGTLMATEGLCYKLYLQFPYSTKSVYSSMPAGYRFLSAFLLGPDRILPGTRASKRTVVFQAMMAYKASDGTWKLYDQSMTGLPTFPPTGATGSAASSS